MQRGNGGQDGCPVFYPDVPTEEAQGLPHLSEVPRLGDLIKTGPQLIKGPPSHTHAPQPALDNKSEGAAAIL